MERNAGETVARARSIPQNPGYHQRMDSMAERYRLLFRGEVLEGQHQAVVKKRLAGLLKTDREEIDALFNGEPNVIKAAVDRADAARYQAAFKKAGARLRVVAIAAKSTSAQSAAEASGPLTLAEPGTTLSDTGPAAPPPPDTSHLSVAAPGSDRVEIESAAAPTVEVDPTWDLAERGADLGQIRRDDAAAPEVADFSLAPLGADMDERQRPAPPPAPDTSHLKLEKGEER